MTPPQPPPLPPPTSLLPSLQQEPQQITTNYSNNNSNNNSSRTLVNEQQVESFLAECGLSQYISIFVEEGFDRLESLFEITEADLTQMQVKRGHRRLLQRAVASARGIPTTVPLNIAPLNIAPLNKPSSEITLSRVAYPSASSQHIARMGASITSENSQQQQQQQQQIHSIMNNNNTNNNISSSNSNSGSGSTNNNLLMNNNTKVSITPSTEATTGTKTVITSSNYNNNNKTNNNNRKNSVSNSKSATPGNEYYASAGTMIHTAASGMSSTEEEAVTSDNIHRLWKRKYHRHAKPDSNAPLKPPSAYVMFSNDVRQELKDENRSFTDLAKIIGDRWKNISAEEKERYETNALAAREEYLKKVEEYQKTDAYKKYQEYITEFKAQNEAAARPVGRPRKRHRKEGDKWVSDGTVSDYSSHTRRASSTSSQLEDVNQQKHYLHYLLNDDNNTPPPPPSSSSSTAPTAPLSSASSSTPQTSNSDQQTDSIASSSTSISNSSFK